MTIRNLHHALAPASVAVVGASEREGAPGTLVMRNILAGGFAGPVWPVNPRRARVMGLDAYPGPEALPEAPDLAVVASPPRSLAAVIAGLGARGCRVAVVLTAGVGAAESLAMLTAARPHLLRVIGPGSTGLAIPAMRLNATLAGTPPAPGRLGLVSQSGVLATTLIDWAAERGIGFAQVASLGDMADVDIGDWLDLLAGDGRSGVVLAYLETIPAARKFLSAGRACARLKPVVAIKAGRHAAGATAARTHTGGLLGSDEVADAALSRAGILRVEGLAELFDAAEIMGRFRPLTRGRLGIVTNGGAAGVLAVDRLMDVGGELAEPAAATIRALDRALPAWSRGNPADIHADAPPERYLAALEAFAADPGVDALLALHCPSALAPPEAAARGIAARLEAGRLGGKPLLAAWLGGTTARAGRALLREAGVASFASPAEAAAAVGHLTGWGRAQAALMHVPDRGEEAALACPADAREAAAAIFRVAADAGRAVLTEPEAKRVLAAYGVPVTDTRVAPDPAAAEALAVEMLGAAGRVVLKLLSRDVTHKSDVGGVVLGLDRPDEVRAAAEAMLRRLARRAPDAVIDGFTLQPMVRKPAAEELLLGIGRDPVFGPVIVFGGGGTRVDALRDTAVALPPLDMALAADLVGRTRIGRVLAGYRDRPPADADAIHHALIALSHLVEDFPCIRAADVNPLVAGQDGAIALDARIEIEPGDIDRPGPNPDLAIRPYPAAWRREAVLGGARFALRPIRPTDVLLYPDFLARLDPEALRMRFLAPRAHFSDAFGIRLTQLDYDRDMAFVALDPDGALAGVSRLAADPDRLRAEYALIVRSDLGGRGLGTALMRLLIDYARAEGLERLEGAILAENDGMIRLVRRLGFTIARDPEDFALVASTLDLAGAPA